MREMLALDKAALEKRLADQAAAPVPKDDSAQLARLQADLDQAKQALAAASANQASGAQADSAQSAELKRALAAAQQADADDRDALGRIRAQLDDATQKAAQNA